MQMKEIDLKTIELLINEKIDVVNFNYIAIFVLLNLIIAIANWIIQRNVKKIENKIYKKKVREDKRITIIEEIYKDLVSYTYIMDPINFSKSIKKTSMLEKKIVENKLYIDNSLCKKITKYLDYTKDVASDFRKKDFKKETELLESIVKEFNK